MKTSRALWRGVGAFALLLAAGTGCESTDGGETSVSGSAYYGTGFYDPWYHGGYWYDDPDIIVTPPPTKPEAPVAPAHPIATPRPTPMPSIPSAPRPAFRR